MFDVTAQPQGYCPTADALVPVWDDIPCEWCGEWHKPTTVEITG